MANSAVTLTGTQAPTTTPAANAVIATIAAGSLTSAGVYRVKVYACITGTTVAAVESVNMNLRAGANVIGLVPLDIPGVAGNAAIFGPYEYEVVLDGLSALTVNAVALATTGGIYWAAIQADFLSGSIPASLVI